MKYRGILIGDGVLVQWLKVDGGWIAHRGGAILATGQADDLREALTAAKLAVRDWLGY